MFKSIFSRYITAFMVIVLTSYLVFATVTGFMITIYSSQSNGDISKKSADIISDAMEQAYERSGFDDFNQYVFYDSANIRQIIDIIPEYYSGVSVIVTDKEGTILMTDDEGESDIFGTVVSKDIFKKFTQNMDYEEYGTLSGVFESDRHISGKKLIHEITGCYGYVFVSSSGSVMADLLNGLVKTLGIAALWTLAATLVAVYFLSEKIMTPLRDISAATKKFAKGNFDVRIPVSGSDEIAELATAFNNMAVSLENNDKSRSIFLGNISHDLRTPMTTISGFVDGMLDGAIPKDKYDYYLRIVSNETKRLSRLVSTLLDITKIQAGERKFNSTEFDICETARQIIISCEQRLNDKHLDVEFVCDEDNMLVYADTDAVYQVLYNLCDNAIKFSDDGGKYRVSVVRDEDKVFVSVYNEGTGIKAEELPFIFDRFYKSDKSRGLDRTGVGLGLYICKAIVEAQGEEIWVKSEYGKNCEFVFTLQSALSSEEDI